MVQKRLGDAGTALFKRQRTGAEALAEASGVREKVPPTSARVRERAEEGNWVVTTFRIRKEQWRWLRQQALDRAMDRGRGRADASDVVRELIDQAMS